MTQPRVEQGLPTNHINADVSLVGVRRAPLGLIPVYSSLNTCLSVSWIKTPSWSRKPNQTVCTTGSYTRLFEHTYCSSFRNLLGIKWTNNQKKIHMIMMTGPESNGDLLLTPSLGDFYLGWVCAVHHRVLYHIIWTWIYTAFSFGNKMNSREEIHMIRTGTSYCTF
jgi:hypothetical protein